MSPGNPFILGSKGQRSSHEAQKALSVWVMTLLWVPASSSTIRSGWVFDSLSSLARLFVNTK